MIQYDGVHSIQLIRESTPIFNSKGKMNGKNTWKDWGLVPLTRPTPNPPGVKTNYIEIPGANGSIDASTVLTSYPVYNNRGLSQEFYVDNNKTWTINGRKAKKSWEERYTEIEEYCHGQKMKVVLDDDSSYYYVGRVGVNAWKSDKDWSKITIDFNLEPFKYYMFDSTEPWLWDPFRFTDGIITNPSNYVNVTVERANSATPVTIAKKGGGTTTVYKDKEFAVNAMAMPIICDIEVTPKQSVTVTNGVSDTSIRIYRIKTENNVETVTVDKTYTFTTQTKKSIHMYDVKYRSESGRLLFDTCAASKKFNVTVKFRNGRL